MTSGVYKRTEKIKKKLFNKGHIPWNKGMPCPEETKKKISQSEKGRSPNITSFKTGKVPWNKGKKFIQITGKNHHNWKGGITTQNHYLRTIPKWRMWREAVFRRDDFTCQNPNCEFCNNEVGVELHPHHIKPISLYPEKTYDVDNGITYCAKFHMKTGLHKNIRKKINHGGGYDCNFRRE